MANEIGGVWRTVGGRRIFIKDRQNLEAAMKASGKFNKLEKEKYNKKNANRFVAEKEQLIKKDNNSKKE